MSNPVSCWDEEAPQNHRTRTRPNCLVVSLWNHDPGDGKEAWQESIQGTQTLDFPEIFTAHIVQGVRIET
jgi:hypothetical protein